MKTKPVLKSLADLSPEVLLPELDRPAQGKPEPTPTDAETQRETELHIAVPEDLRFGGYQHWGLNE